MCVCVCVSVFLSVQGHYTVYMAYTLSVHKNLQGETCNGTPIALLANGMSQLEGFVIVRVSMERHRAHNYGHSIHLFTTRLWWSGSQRPQVYTSTSASVSYRVIGLSGE